MSDAPSPAPSPTREWSVESIVALLVLAALPLSFASGFTGYEPLKQGVLLIGGGLLLLLWTLRSFRGQRLLVRGVLSIVPMLVLGIVALSSAIWATDPLLAILDGSRWFALTGVALVFLDPLDRPIRFSMMSTVLAVSFALSSIVGLLQAFGVVLDTSAPYLVADGLRGSFDNQRMAALTIAAAMPIMAAGIFDNKGALRYVTGAAMAVCAFYIGAVNDLDAFIALGAGAFVSTGLIALGHGKHGLVPSFGALGALAAATLLVLAGSFTVPHADNSHLPAELQGSGLERKTFAVDEVEWDRVDTKASDSARSYARATGMNIFAAKPLAGVGGGNYDNVAMGYIALDHPHYQATHASRSAHRTPYSSYIHLGAELGAIGFIVFILMLLMTFAAFWQAMRKSAKDSEDGQALPLLHLFGLVGTVVAILTAAAFDDVLYYSAAAAALLFASLGVILRESANLLEDKGLGKPWVIEGKQIFERYVLAGLLPLTLAAGAMYFGYVSMASDFHKARADVWLRAGNIDKAKVSYANAIEAFAGNDSAYFMLAQVSSIRGELPDAEKALLAALDKRPFDARIYTSLGSCQTRLSIVQGKQKIREAKVEGDEKKAKLDGKLGPPPDSKGGGDPLSPQALASHLDREATARAESNYNRAIELHPRYSLPYRQLGNLYVTQKKIDKASAIYLRALKKESKDPQVRADLHIRVGQIYQLDQKWDKAEHHLLKALEIYPEHPGRKSIGTDLAVIDARKNGRPVPEPGHNHGGGAHGPPKPGVDVNAMRKKSLEEKRKSGELPTPKDNGAETPPKKDAPEKQPDAPEKKDGTGKKDAPKKGGEHEHDGFGKHKHE